MHNTMITLVASIVLALCASGCGFNSTTIDGMADSSTPDVADASADTAPDVVPDTVVPPADYSLHEWGVWVLDRWSGPSVHGPSPVYNGPTADKPVIYIHADSPVTLDVQVSFSSGAASEVWPPTPLGSVVRWQDVVAGTGSCDTTPFPNPWDEPWVDETCEACALGSCVVEQASCLTYGDYVSKLLFYAGTMPEFEGALEVVAIPASDGSTVVFDVVNTSGRVVEDVWLTWRITSSVCSWPEWCPVETAELASGFIGSLAAGAGVTMELPVTHLQAELDPDGYPIPGTLGSDPEWESLPVEIRDSLVEKGLTGAEADAFVAAWDLAWFGILGADSYSYEPMYRQGGAVLYSVSEQQYDELLPMVLTPAPEELVRVGMVYQYLEL